MYDFRQLLRGMANPGLAVREVNRLYHTRLGRQTGNPRGIDIFEEDWDNLLILDACRYDMFEEQHSLPGRLESRISKSSHTSEFLQSNFADRDLRDTVYVTASPMYYRNRERLNTRCTTSSTSGRTSGGTRSIGQCCPRRSASSPSTLQSSTRTNDSSSTSCSHTTPSSARPADATSTWTS
ncbi:hypothetical protein ACFQH8_12520 [Halomicroarcula sp. GCM10025710]